MTKYFFECLHTMGVVVVKICVYLVDVLCPRQHNKGNIELVNEPTRTCNYNGNRTLIV